MASGSSRGRFRRRKAGPRARPTPPSWPPTCSGRPPASSRGACSIRSDRGLCSPLAWSAARACWSPPRSPAGLVVHPALGRGRRDHHRGPLLQRHDADHREALSAPADRRDVRARHHRRLLRGAVHAADRNTDGRVGLALGCSNSAGAFGGARDPGPADGAAAAPDPGVQRRGGGGTVAERASRGLQPRFERRCVLPKFC